MKGVPRPNGWEVRLDSFFTERARMPFEWGVQDCSLFAAEGVCAITNKNFAENFRGMYKTALGAQRTLEHHGGLTALIEKYAGPEVDPALAQPGDVGLFEHPYGGQALALHGGSNIWLGAGVNGLDQVEPGAILRCWRAC